MNGGLWITKPGRKDVRDHALVSTTDAELQALIRRRGGVISIADAKHVGLTESALRQACKRRSLHRIRQGVYTLTQAWEQASPRGQHLLKIKAHQRIHPESVACGTSAAIALRLPTPSGPPREPIMLNPRNPLRRGARGSQAGARRRRAWLSADEIIRLPEGIQVTTTARTVVDCAREWSRPWGLAIADAALTNNLVSQKDLQDSAENRPPAPGTERARWVMKHARSGPESPLESLCRGVIICAGLPEPALQVRIQTRTGAYRVDLLDEECKVIVEADGRGKYQLVGDLWDEKLREDALRETGFEVVRFIMQDFYAQDAWLTGYRRARARSASRLGRPVQGSQPQ
jgi:very-short-patch-repair endonuclease/predicted transcriptional regulator of viral defense system